MIEKLSKVQAELKAPKSQRNNFGNYNYRSCEDILEAVKPLLAREGLVLTITDSIEMVGNRYYVKATATVTDGEKNFTTTAFAREAENKKGQDESQITGSSSSYARKYALNGLFCIDDTKDADTMDNTEKPKAAPKAKAKAEAPRKVDSLRAIAAAAKEIGVTNDDIKEVMKRHYNKGASSELTDAEAAEMEKNFVSWVAEVKDDDEKLMEDIDIPL
jgi:hypothetical protein